MSRGVAKSMPAGRTYMPAASMTWASEGAGMPGRTSWMTSPAMRMSAAMVSAAVTTLPLRIRVFIGDLAQRMAWEMRFDAETRRRGDRTRRTQERESRPEKAETAETVALRLRRWVGLRREKDKAGRLPEQTRADCVTSASTSELRSDAQGGALCHSCVGPLRPAFGGAAGFDFGHGDAVLHRADEPAEIAADAFHFVDAGDARGGRGAADGAQGFGFGDRGHGDGGRPGGFIEVDALVRAVPAGDVAEIAADAGLAIDAGDDAVVQVEVLPLGDFGHGQAAEIFDGVEAFLVHPIGEAIMENKPSPSNLGAVVSVRGSVVDIRFDAHLPPIYSLLHAKDGEIARSEE